MTEQDKDLEAFDKWWRGGKAVAGASVSKLAFKTAWQAALTHRDKQVRELVEAVDELNMEYRIFEGESMDLASHMTDKLQRLAAQIKEQDDEHK